MKNDLIKDVLAESPNRRSLLKKIGIASAATGAVFASGGLKLSADPSSPTPIDILQFALNLEYLEAEFYSVATTGKYLNQLGIGTGGSGTYGATTGGNKVTFANYLSAAYVAYEIGEDERAHVTLLRGALSSAGVVPIAKPEINLDALGIGFSDENSFLTLARIFEDIGVTAYSGAAQLPSFASSPYIGTAARILAAEAEHVGAIRVAVSALGLPTKQLDGVDIIPPPSGRDFFSLNGNGLCELRSPGQVLFLAYGGIANSTGAGFFPKGVNGNLHTSSNPA